MNSLTKTIILGYILCIGLMILGKEFEKAYTLHGQISSITLHLTATVIVFITVGSCMKYIRDKRGTNEHQ